MLAVQAEDQGLIPRSYIKKSQPLTKTTNLCVVVHACGPSTGKADTGGSPRLVEWGRPSRVKDFILSVALSLLTLPHTVPPCLGMKAPCCAKIATSGSSCPHWLFLSRLSCPPTFSWALCSHALFAFAKFKFIHSQSPPLPLPADFPGTCWEGMLSPVLALKSPTEAT